MSSPGHERAVMERKIEKGQMTHILQAYGFQGFATKESVQHLFFHIRRVEVPLKIKDASPKQTNLWPGIASLS
jgi:hypothetical protein